MFPDHEEQDRKRTDGIAV